MHVCVWGLGSDSEDVSAVSVALVVVDVAAALVARDVAVVRAVQDAADVLVVQDAHVVGAAVAAEDADPSTRTDIMNEYAHPCWIFRQGFSMLSTHNSDVAIHKIG